MFSARSWHLKRNTKGALSCVLNSLRVVTLLRGEQYYNFQDHKSCCKDFYYVYELTYNRVGYNFSHKIFFFLNSTCTKNHTMLHSWNRDMSFKNFGLKVYGALIFFTLFIEVTDSYPKCTLSQKTGIFIPWVYIGDGRNRTCKTIKHSKKQFLLQVQILLWMF